MATKPNPEGTQPPPKSGTNRRMITPPPPAAARKSTGQVPVAKGPSSTSAGAIPPVRTPPPPPGGGGGSSGAAQKQPGPAGGGSPTRTMARPKTQGMPIKTKIVVAMSGLTVGVSLLIFLIVMFIATSSLESTIEQAGVGMLQQAEAIHRPYKAGLNERGLIAYFSQPGNRTKFDAYWKKTSDDWFSPSMPACREFANWEQFKDDRIWVKTAADYHKNRDRFALNDVIGQEIFGEGWKELATLPKDGKLREPLTPRRINDAAMEKAKHNFPDLFSKYGMNASADTFARLKTKIHDQTDKDLIHHSNGLRKKIFLEFHDDFVKDLDVMTMNEESQIRYFIFIIPPNELPGFDSDYLNVVSPTPSGVKLEATDFPVNAPTIGEVKIDRTAKVKDVPAYGFRKELGPSESITIYLDQQEIQSRKSSLLIWILLVSLLGIGLAVFLAFLIGTSITKPLQTLMNDIQVISGGNFDHRPAARSRDEIGIVARLLGDMAAGLKSAQSVWLENQGRKHDLDIAKEIQENLLPKHVPRIAGYDVSAYYSPSKEVGGDYYDFFLVDKTHLGMICADVSGKGIPGSMVMMMAKALVSYEAESNLSPRDIFCKVNRTLAKDIKRGMFVTAFYMLLDIPTARLTVASAGHNPLLLYRAATKQCVEVNPGGIALGFDKDGRLFERNMKEEVIQLQRGDRAVIYTDGVTEAMSPGGEEFGEERLQAITIQAAGRSSSEYLTTLVNAIQGHAQTDDQHDDITIVTLKVG
jgi:serine phosphatase RsbU (regulator of sigma subunit)